MAVQTDASRSTCPPTLIGFCLVQAWLAALGVELWSHAPPSSLAGVLERAVGSEALRHCPLLWRCYARLEASRQRPDAVRR